MTAKLAQLEERLQKLEIQVRELQKATGQVMPAPWHRQAFGQFKDDPVFDQIVRLGKELRDQEQAPKQTGRKKSKTDSTRQKPWYDQILGMFDDDPGFDDMVRRGQELRKQDRGLPPPSGKRTTPRKGSR